MKRYAVWPGLGKLRSRDEKEVFMDGRAIAACYCVPYSECIDMEHPAIKKAATYGAKFDGLIHLLPQMSGIYRLPNRNENKIIVREGLGEQVKK